MNYVGNLLVGLCFSVFGFCHSANASEIRATVEVKVDKKTKAANQMIFSTKPASGLIVNDEGPWKLEIKGSKGVDFKVKEVKRGEWIADVAGFRVDYSPVAGAKDAEVEFKMVTFVCTKDKSICYREVVSQKSKVIL
jgi:hypothetical protein